MLRLLTSAFQRAISLSENKKCFVEHHLTWLLRLSRGQIIMGLLPTFGRLVYFCSVYSTDFSHSRGKLMQSYIERSTEVLSKWSEVTFQTTARTFSRKCSILTLTVEWQHQSCSEKTGFWLIQLKSARWPRSEESSRPRFLKNSLYAQSIKPFVFQLLWWTTWPVLHNKMIKTLKKKKLFIMMIKITIQQEKGATVVMLPGKQNW